MLRAFTWRPRLANFAFDAAFVPIGPVTGTGPLQGVKEGGA